MEAGAVEPVVKLLTRLIEDGVRERFNHAMTTKKFNTNDVAGGRVYVDAYVSYIHYVEGLYEAATSAAHGHDKE